MAALGDVAAAFARPQTAGAHVVTDSGVTLDTRAASKPALKRALSLSHATLYGLGVTIGAGIYVLIGAAASRAGLCAASSSAQQC